jgi:hypothetical protein
MYLWPSPSEVQLNKYIGSIFDADLTKDAESRESHNVCFAICTDLKGQGFVGVDHHPPVFIFSLNVIITNL